VISIVRNCLGSAAVHIDTSADPEGPTLNVPALISTGCRDLFPDLAYQQA
jgi:hypothetical protein